MEENHMRAKRLLATIGILGSVAVPLATVAASGTPAVAAMSAGPNYVYRS
jgi:hypothetical protein